MITCKTKKWGNSLGILIPREEVLNLNLKEEQQIVVEIIKTKNPLKELFGQFRSNPITKKDFQETRKFLESTRF